MKVGVIGLGKLGLPMLCAFIKQGFDVLGYDTNLSLVKELSNGIINLKEHGVSEIAKNDDKWNSRFTDNFYNIFNHSEVLFIIVPTPSLPSGFFDKSYLEKSLENINNLSIQNNIVKTIVITSTVNPEDCDYLSDKFTNLNIVYSPEFIALGTVIKDMLNPDVCLIGHRNIGAANFVKSIYERFYESIPNYYMLSFVEAEIAKISINSYTTMKITFANTVGSYLYNLTNGDRKKIRRTLMAIGSDSRINNKYFKFGTGYGGTCFPRDNRCLSVNIKKQNINAELPVATDNINDWMLTFFKNKIDYKNYENIVYVGLTYKQNSGCLEESFVLKLHELIYQPDKNYYFIDEMINDYKGIEKITDTNFLIKKNTLYLINYHESNLNFNECNVFNFWA